jgi:hypothetical protein
LDALTNISIFTIGPVCPLGTGIKKEAVKPPELFSFDTV